MSTNESDLFLWRAFREGDEDAYAKIYTTYVNVLYRYGLKMTADTQLIEDGIQDLFIELWKSRARLSDTDSIKFYLFRVMRRKIYKLLTNQSMGRNNELALHTEPMTDSYENVLIATQETAAQEDRLRSALTILPARQREAVNLRYFHGFSYEQIADIMDINVQSVHNTLQKALKLLRASLSTIALIGYFISFLVFF